MSEFEPLQIDNIDIELACQRQRLVLLMIKDGMLDPENGGQLFIDTARADQVAAARRALKKNRDGDSPLARLYDLYYKLSSNQR